MKKRTRVLAAVLAVLVLLAAALILNGPKISGWVLRQMYPRRFSGTVSREAEEFALPEGLIYAVIRSESGFDPKASSHAYRRDLPLDGRGAPAGKRRRGQL